MVIASEYLKAGELDSGVVCATSEIVSLLLVEVRNPARFGVDPVALVAFEVMILLLWPLAKWSSRGNPGVLLGW